MRLVARDQISLSSVKADSLRPGEEFEVSDSMGADLLEKHPDKFRLADGESKAAPAHENKMEQSAPSNKKSKRKEND